MESVIGLGGEAGTATVDVRERRELNTISKFIIFATLR